MLLLWYWPGWPRFPQLAWTSQAIHSVMVLTRLAAASPDFYHLSAQPTAGLSEALGPGFDPGLPRSDWVLDARETWISICVPLEVWNPQPIKHNVQLHFANHFYKNCTAYVKPHPWTASIHTVNFGSSRPSPVTQSDQPWHVILQSTCILQKKCIPVFSISWTGRRNNLFWKA